MSNYLLDPLIWPLGYVYLAGYFGVWVALFGLTRLMADGTQPGSYERAAVASAVVGLGLHLLAGVALSIIVTIQASERLASMAWLPVYLLPYVACVILDFLLILGALRTRTG